VNTPSDAELIIRLLVSALLGGVIGFERELRDHPAGLRTHITVSIGSALFVIAGAYGFGEFVTSGNTNVVVGVDRVASTVVTGIGFLGGGAILKHGATVRGLTTAGSLWVTAAIGLAVGLGSYAVAVAATLATVVTLVALVRMKPDADPSGVIAAVAGLESVTLRSVVIRHEADGAVAEFSLVGRRGAEMAAAVAPITERDDVEAVELA
jgi:uncharacterized membrane protein YhiD involved in acid resistance